MISGMYIFKDGEIIPTDDMAEWSKYFGEEYRRVAKTVVGDVEVSTVFLGIDHSFVGGDPVLFETMIFGGEYDQEQWRYCTLEEAMLGHERAVILINSSAG